MGTQEEYEARLAALEAGFVEAEIDPNAVESVLPADAGQSLIAAVAELTEGGTALSGAQFEAVEWAGGGRSLDDGVRAVARQLGVPEADVRAAAEEGDTRVVMAVLEACAGPDWLAVAEGRGGKPMTKAELGIRDESVIDTSLDMGGLAAASRARRRWWSRG